MNLLSLISLVFVPVVVRAQAPPINTLINIVDFKGNVFDLANFNPAPLVPIQSLARSGSSPSSQRWEITPVTGTVFNILNPLLSTFLSYTGATSGFDPICTQICSQPNVNTQWNITLSANKLGFNIHHQKRDVLIRRCKAI
ncbi:hypothetical protein C8R45DRAFT_965974 [Mycena sanguinolenta]|nr:hypothetical protein C8R45DRAFT_965974 [Mycena sanguinolenta]